MQYKNINLIGRIDESLVKKFLLEYEMKQKNNISFFIHSTGGYIDSALEIANYMLSLDKEFISVAGTRVASAAIILHQVAPLVRMAYKNSEFLLHRQYKKNRGKISLDEQEKEKSIFNLIALQTGLPLQQIYELADAETKFSAKEAFDLGFVTKVIDSPSPAGGILFFLKNRYSDVMNHQESFIPQEKAAALEEFHTISPEEVVVRLKEKVSFFDEEKIENLYQEASFEMPRFRPNIEDFTDVYSVEEIKHDLNYVYHHEKEWEQGNNEQESVAKKLAVVAEYLLFKYFGRWSQGKIQPILPSEYDDYKRRIDMIFEIINFDKDNTYHACSFDVVLGSSERFIEKMVFTAQNIQNGYALRGPKYFKPDGKNVFSGTIAAGIVSLPGLEIKKIIEQDLSDESTIPKSIIPHLVISQLLIQYKGFESYARKKGNHMIAETYRVAHEDLETASYNILADLAFDSKLNEKIKNHLAIRTLNKFFEIYLEQSENTLEEKTEI